MLVVIAIIGILAAILLLRLPAPEAARRDCQNNLKQHGIIFSYAGEQASSFPARNPLLAGLPDGPQGGEVTLERAYARACLSGICRTSDSVLPLHGDYSKLNDNYL